MAEASNADTKKDPRVRCQSQALVGLTGLNMPPLKRKGNVAYLDDTLSILCLELCRCGFEHSRAQQPFPRKSKPPVFFR